MVWFVREDFLWMNCVGCKGCAVCSESDADGLHGYHLSSDCIQGPTGHAMHLPYPVEIAAMYFSFFYFDKTLPYTAAHMHMIRSIITDKSVVSSLKSVQRPNCPATVPAPPVIADYNTK